MVTTDENGDQRQDQKHQDGQGENQDIFKEGSSYTGPHSLPPSPCEDSPCLIGSTKFDPYPGAKNIMITGGAGFIGSWVTRHMTVQYPHYRIICFDTLDTPASHENIRHLFKLPNFVFVRGCITKVPQVMNCLRKYEIDTIMHFAAQSHVDLSFGNSFSFTIMNVVGTHVLLDCARKWSKIDRFIHVSTDEVYGEVDNEASDLIEASLLAPTNPYAASKAAAEMYVNAYYKSFKLPVIIVRSNNVYGPNQYPEKIIPKFTISLELGLPLFLHGNGTHKRRYLHASDAANAFDTIFHRGKVGQIYNVSSTDEIDNMTVSRKILAEFGFVTEEQFNDRVQHCKDRPFNDMRYAVDGGKLKSLGWEQLVDFEDGLKSTIEWYRTWGLDWWGGEDKVRECCSAFPSPKRSIFEDDVSGELVEFENHQVQIGKCLVSIGYENEEMAEDGEQKIVEPTARKSNDLLRGLKDTFNMDTLRSLLD
ncbi:NAD(P)-binding protein [Ascobolus immersus RN42]|uniref:NAD(P)-binding protein n=1 Tax=Ascobolus immersus RN42 TaxID=1160509 RepID=A0A3N4IHW7_ASCIM|nr:NAD(P)-binding protein [Ascobolus immersus RN42]